MKVKEAIAEIRESGLYGNQVHMETLELALEALEKQMPKKPITDDNRILCPVCNLFIAYNKSVEQHCWTCGQNLEGCVIK